MRQSQPRSKSPVTKFLSLALALCMIAAFIPAFTLTASAAGAITIGESTLIYDTTSLAAGLDAFTFEFDLTSETTYSGGFKDVGVTDADDNVFAALCFAWRDGDGFFPFDGEKTGRGSSFTDLLDIRQSGDYGSIAYRTYSGDVHIRVAVINDTSADTYTVTYYTVVNDEATQFATATYTGYVNGISLPSEWDYTNGGGGTPISTYVTAANSGNIFTNFAVYDSDNGITLYSSETTIDPSDYLDSYDWYAFEFNLGTLSSAQDFGFTDADGNVFLGACDAWMSNDGFYVGNGERSSHVTIDSDWTNPNLTSGGYEYGNIKYATYGESPTVRVVVEPDADSQEYTMSFYVNNDTSAFATPTYQYTTAAPVGVSVPASWYYPSWDSWCCSGIDSATAAYAFSNFKVYAGEYSANSNTVTINYKDGDTVVSTFTVTYDPDLEVYADGYTFAAQYIYYNDSEVYYLPEATITADTDISVSPYRYLSDDFKDKSTFTYDGIEYVPADGADTFTNVIVNGDFATGDTTAWTNRYLTDLTYGTVAYDSELGTNALTISPEGVSNNNKNNIGQIWTVETGTTYYMSFYVGGGRPSYTSSTNNNTQYNQISDAYTLSSSTTISGNILFSYGYDMTANVWNHFEKVFTAETDTVYFQSSWVSGIKFAAFQLIPIEPNTEKLANVTVYYTLDGTADTVIEDLTQTTTVTKGNSVSFDAVSAYLYDGAYYKYDAITYDDVQADITEYFTLDIDTSVFAPTAALSWNFTTGKTAYASSFSGSGYAFDASKKDGLMAVSWNNVRHSLLKFNVETESDKALTGATLHVTLGRSNDWSNDYFTVYAVNPALIDGDNETIDVATGSTLSEAISALGGYLVVDRTNTAGSNPTTFDLVIDLSDYLTTFPDAGSEVAFMIVATNGQLGFYRTGEYAPYLSDITTVDTVTYSVDYVDTLGTALDTSLTEDAASGSYTTTEANTLGYNNEVVCDYVPIPYFTGYVFKSKTVDASEKKITLIYEETDTDAYFFDTADSDATLISLNMLGAHDAFTANIDTVKYDAAGIATSDSGSESFIAAQGSSLSVNMSKAQSADALELLNSGVRYFDIRLSHSTVDVDYEASLLGITYATYTAPHTNGVFYTTHGGLSDEFRPIAYTIAQWAKQHPGEIIVLNFQSAFEDGGTATTTTWSAINAILDESGINDYVSIKNSNAGSGNLAGATISSYTDDREHAGILVFGQSTGANNNIGNFILNKYGDEFGGRLYSNYETGLSTGIQSSFSANYVQSQVDYADTFGSGNDNHIITWMMRVMQAQSESTDLIGQADDDNTALYNALASGDHTDWLTALPIVMVNDAVTNTTDLVALLRAHNNAREITVNYVNGESTVATKTKSLMTGTLYTDETTRGIINGSDAKYYVTAAPTTVYNNGIILVPSTGDISVNVTATGDIYTYASADGTDRTEGTILNSTLVTTTDTETTYTGLTSFGACNWGSDGTYDRIGIAVLDLPDKTESGVASAYTDAVSYVLKATQVRSYSEGYLNTKFYAIPYSTYLATDFSVGTNVTDLIKDATPIAKYSKEESSDAKAETAVEYTLTLDDEYTDKIVIIGCSTVGLYVLTDMSIEPEINYGIELIDGAQIRIGDGVTDANELNGDESGLRFIAVLTTANTLASYVVDETVNATAGIAIWDGGVTTETVDASAIAKADLDSPVANYDANRYQNGTDTIFSVAITNINSANYNRIYVAVPYIKIGDTYYYNYDEAVARTPYQVAAGILTDNSDTLKDSQGNTYVYSSDVDSLLIKVLNVYANKTGARITLNSSYNAAVAEYSNGAAAFFDVDCAPTTDDEGNELGTYTITFTVKDGGAQFYSYAADTYRVNKSHTDFETYFGVEEGDVTISDDGTQMTIIIDPNASSAGTETE